MKKTINSYLDIAKSLPLSDGDILFIASDLKQLALKCRENNERFSVNDFIQSFQNLLNNGTIVIPAYTDHLKSGDLFDYKNSKPTTGALSNKIMKRKDFVRTKDPLHSVFVWGKGAKEIFKLDVDSTFGRGSIFDFLYINKAKMICIDVAFQNSFTFVHYIEEKLKVNYRKNYTYNINTLFEGKKSVKAINFHTRRPYVATKLNDFEAFYKRKNPDYIFNYRGVEITYIDLYDMFDFTVNYINSGKKLYRVDLILFAKNIAKSIIKKLNY